MDKLDHSNINCENDSTDECSEIKTPKDINCENNSTECSESKPSKEEESFANHISKGLYLQILHGWNYIVFHVFIDVEIQ